MESPEHGSLIEQVLASVMPDDTDFEGLVGIYDDLVRRIVVQSAPSYVTAAMSMMQATGIRTGSHDVMAVTRGIDTSYLVHLHTGPDDGSRQHLVVHAVVDDTRPELLMSVEVDVGAVDPPVRFVAASGNVHQMFELSHDLRRHLVRPVYALDDDPLIARIVHADGGLTSQNAEMLLLEVIEVAEGHVVSEIRRLLEVIGRPDAPRSWKSDDWSFDVTPDGSRTRVTMDRSDGSPGYGILVEHDGRFHYNIGVSGPGIESATIGEDDHAFGNTTSMKTIADLADAVRDAIEMHEPVPTAKLAPRPV